VLKERTADLSRRHQVPTRTTVSWHITRRQMTTYRKWPKTRSTPFALTVPGLKAVRTKNLRFHGVGPWRGTSERERHLYERFGEDARVILDMIAATVRLGEYPIEGQPYVGPNSSFRRFEMATVVDRPVDAPHARAPARRARHATARASRRARRADWAGATRTCSANSTPTNRWWRREFGAAGLTL